LFWMFFKSKIKFKIFNVFNFYNVFNTFNQSLLNVCSVSNTQHNV
jgi:hypothetical protein